MNMKRFGLIVAGIFSLVFLYGAFLFLTGQPDDGRYRMKKGQDPFSMISDNMERVERRKEAKTPLLVGFLGGAIGLGLAASARKS